MYEYAVLQVYTLGLSAGALVSPHGGALISRDLRLYTHSCIYQHGKETTATLTRELRQINTGTKVKTDQPSVLI